MRIVSVLCRETSPDPHIQHQTQIQRNRPDEQRNEVAGRSTGEGQCRQYAAHPGGEWGRLQAAGQEVPGESSTDDA